MPFSFPSLTTETLVGEKALLLFSATLLKRRSWTSEEQTTHKLASEPRLLLYWFRSRGGGGLSEVDVRFLTNQRRAFCQGLWFIADSTTDGLWDLGQDPLALWASVSSPTSEWIGLGGKIVTSTWRWIGAEACGVQLPLVSLRWHYPATCSQPEASSAWVKNSLARRHSCDACLCYTKMFRGWCRHVLQQKAGQGHFYEGTGRDSHLMLAKHPTLPLGEAFRTVLQKILKLPFWWTHLWNTRTKGSRRGIEWCVLSWGFISVALGFEFFFQAS